VTPGHVATAAAVFVFLVGAYLVRCLIWPMADCWCCDGDGHHRPEPNGKRRSKISRPCRWCRHTGKRLRLGRRIINRVRRTRKAAK